MSPADHTQNDFVIDDIPCIDAAVAALFPIHVGSETTISEISSTGEAGKRQTQISVPAKVNEEQNELESPLIPRDASRKRMRMSEQGTKLMWQNFGTTRLQKQCKNCNSDVCYDASCGEEVCRNCGCVVETNVISEGQEWRSFSADSGGGGQSGSSRNRVGGALNAWLDDCTENTTLLGASRRLLQLNKSATSSGGDKILKNAFSNLLLMAEALNLREDVVERAKEIIKELDSQNQLKNRGHTAIGLAVVYLASREAGLPQSLKDLTMYDATLTERDIGRVVNRLRKLLPHRLPMQLEGASQMIPRFAARLGIPMKLVDLASTIVKASQSLLTSAHRPNSLAAGALYLVGLLTHTDDDLLASSAIQTATGVGLTTMKSIQKQLVMMYHKILPKDVIDMYQGRLQELLKNDKANSTPGNF